MTMNSLKLVARIVGMLVLGSAGTVLASEARQAAPRAIVGTWLVQVQQRSCSTQAPLGPAFYALLTFAGGGTMTGTTSAPVFAPGQRTGDFGVWSYSRHGTFSVVSDAFILADSAATPPGLRRGLQRITQTITIQPDAPNTFDSDAEVEFFAMSGERLASGCATATGQRFE